MLILNELGSLCSIAIVLSLYLLGFSPLIPIFSLSIKIGALKVLKSLR